MEKRKERFNVHKLKPPTLVWGSSPGFKFWSIQKTPEQTPHFSREYTNGFLDFKSIKTQQNIITTVLLVLVVILLIVLLSMFIIRTVNDRIDDANVKLIKPSITINRAATNLTDVSMTLHRASDPYFVNKILIVLKDVPATQNNIVMPVPDVAETRLYIFNSSISIPKSAEIYPIINYKGKDRIGVLLDSTDKFLVTEIVKINVAPTLDSIGDKSINEGKKLEFSIRARDYNSGDPLVITSENLPSGAVLTKVDYGIYNFTWTPAVGLGGQNFTVDFFVSDGSLNATQSINISVLTVCNLTNAYWNQSSVVNGSLVTMTVDGTNCSGKDINFSIYEDEGGSNDYIFSLINIFSSSSWVANWIDDNGAFAGTDDPEYYFEASLVEDASVRVKSGLLNVTLCIDGDGDGYSITGGSCGAVDCDDSNGSIHPGAIEIFYDYVDNDCVGGDKADNDSDGYCLVGYNIMNKVIQCNSESGIVGTDCNDTNRTIWRPILGYRDVDGDGYGMDPQLPVCSGSSLLSGYSLVNGDCDDNNLNVSPGKTEIFENGIDDDCNASTLDAVPGLIAKWGFENNLSDSVGGNDGVCSVTGGCNYVVGRKAGSFAVNFGGSNYVAVANEEFNSKYNYNGSVQDKNQWGYVYCPSNCWPLKIYAAGQYWTKDGYTIAAPWNYVGIDSISPSYNADYTGFLWLAPRTGTINITANIMDITPQCGSDGINFVIENNTDGPGSVNWLKNRWFFQTYPNAFPRQNISLLKTVQVGQNIFFGVDQLANSVCDTTENNFTIKYADMPRNKINNFNVGDNYTVSAWVKINDGTTNKTIFGDNYRLQFLISGNTPKIVRSKWLDLGFPNAIYQELPVFSGPALPLNTWVLLSLTFNGTYFSLYYNSTKVANSGLITFNPVSREQFNFEGFRIGDKHTSAGAIDFFRGAIDEVRIYNRSLSASEVATLYNA
jgi:hypothetical protein